MNSNESFRHDQLLSCFVLNYISSRVVFVSNSHSFAAPQSLDLFADLCVEIVRKLKIFFIDALSGQQTNRLVEPLTD